MLGSFGIIARIAARNIFASGINLVIGLIIFVGTALVVVGSSFLDSVDGSMSRSITGSLAGHVQVYSDKSKDDVALYGNFGNEADLSPITDYPRIKKELGALSNVQWVVPMGINLAFITSGNTIDLVLADLRDVVREELSKGKTPELKQREETLKSHVRQIVSILRKDLANLDELSSDTEGKQHAQDVVAKASAPAFWESFDQDPLAALEFLENNVAPQLADADFLGMRYVGTDLDLFRRAFDRLQIVSGEMVPPGHRGMLLSQSFYDEFLKLKTARRLDKIKEVLDTGHGRESIAKNPDLQRYIRENKTQTREIVFQLDEPKTKKAIAILQNALHSQKTDLEALLVDFFQMDDSNFAKRYQLFYASEGLAPLLKLYRLRIGDNITLNAYTKGGYAQSANIRIYGTYEFKGMGAAPLAGAINLMDIISFRDLFGNLSEEDLAEIRSMQKAAGAKKIDRSNAEAELFGESHDVVSETHSGAQEALSSDALKGLKDAHRAQARTTTFSPEQIDNGMVLNAALILKDPSQLKKTMEQVKQLSDSAGLHLKVKTWQEAAGILGQMVLFLKIVLYFFVFVIFLVALVIINNAMMMATMQRVQEIGTMRALGAQRGFILSMVLTETAALGLVFGTAGSAMGSAIMLLLHHKGVPAGTNAVIRFFFSGPVLYPTLGVMNVVAAFVIVLVVSAFSTLYPAIVATRVAPVRAMQTEE